MRSIHGGAPALRLARELAVPGARPTPRERLRQREADSSAIDQLLAEAAAARAPAISTAVRGRRCRSTVHSRAAAHQQHALEGREDALSDLLQQAEAETRGPRLRGRRGDRCPRAGIRSGPRRPARCAGRADPGARPRTRARRCRVEARATRGSRRLPRGARARCRRRDAREGLARTAVAWADRAQRAGRRFRFRRGRTQPCGTRATWIPNRPRSPRRNGSSRNRAHAAIGCPWRS